MTRPEKRKRLSGAALNSAAWALARTLNRYSSIAYATLDGTVYSINARFGWREGKLGDFGLCGDAYEAAHANPGYLYIHRG